MSSSDAPGWPSLTCSDGDLETHTKRCAVRATHDKSTVAGLFADPPDWLVTQLKVYRKNPARHKKPLCAAVAAIVLGDGARAPEVADEVERALEENTQS
jgi:hypothetical protein